MSQAQRYRDAAREMAEALRCLLMAADAAEAGDAEASNALTVQAVDAIRRALAAIRAK